MAEARRGGGGRAVASVGFVDDQAAVLSTRRGRGRCYELAVM